VRVGVRVSATRRTTNADQEVYRERKGNNPRLDWLVAYRKSPTLLTTLYPTHPHTLALTERSLQILLLSGVCLQCSSKSLWLVLHCTTPYCTALHTPAPPPQQHNTTLQCTAGHGAVDGLRAHKSIVAVPHCTTPGYTTSPRTRPKNRLYIPQSRSSAAYCLTPSV
jgi:hypothetical protein